MESMNRADRLKINVVLDDGAYMPEKAHEADAGFDLRAPGKVIILPKSARIIPTGVHIEIPFGDEFGIMKEVYKEAYKIYDFRNSGKKDFVADIELIKRLDIEFCEPRKKRRPIM